MRERIVPPKRSVRKWPQKSPARRLNRPPAGPHRQTTYERRALTTAGTLRKRGTTLTGSLDGPEFADCPAGVLGEAAVGGGTPPILPDSRRSEPGPARTARRARDKPASRAGGRASRASGAIFPA